MSKYIMDSNGVHPLGDVIECYGNRYIKERECYVIGVGADECGCYYKLSCGHRLYSGNEWPNYCTVCGAAVVE